MISIIVVFFLFSITGLLFIAFDFFVAKEILKLMDKNSRQRERIHLSMSRGKGK